MLGLPHSRQDDRRLLAPGVSAHHREGKSSYERGGSRHIASDFERQETNSLGLVFLEEYRAMLRRSQTVEKREIKHSNDGIFMLT